MTAYVPVGALFSIGIGPSSSHTVGPLRAANEFVVDLIEAGSLDSVVAIRCKLYGSLGATGVGHGTMGAVVAGLTGADVTTCDPRLLTECWEQVQAGKPTRVGSNHPVLILESDIELAPLTRQPGHSNALRLTALGHDDEVLLETVYYSTGGGFIERADQPSVDQAPITMTLPYRDAADLLRVCAEHQLTMAEVAQANELSDLTAAQLTDQLSAIWAAMSDSIDAGLRTDGRLPGPLNVHRRAPELARRLTADPGGPHQRASEWLQAYAIAVNEENAAGGRVVTAPTNGAAGIIPAVGRYFWELHDDPGPSEVQKYLLTATAIGSLFKSNGSISGAEAGCQGEVGSACAMAAGALCAVWGGSPEQIENAAEIALEHHLGLTCDPVAGLVQIPCIERNAVASGTAVGAARLALNGDGSHHVSLDVAILTMVQTGADMSHKYKETSMGGLALSVPLC